MADMETYLTVRCEQLEAENAVLREALVEARANLIWATGGWGATDSEMLTAARITMRGYVDAIDAALSTAPARDGGE